MRDDLPPIRQGEMRPTQRQPFNPMALVTWGLVAALFIIAVIAFAFVFHSGDLHKVVGMVAAVLGLALGIAIAAIVSNPARSPVE